MAPFHTRPGGLLIESGDMSANITPTTIMHLGGKERVGIQVTVSSAAALTGDLTLQCSNDGTNWDEVTFKNEATGSEVQTLALSADGTTLLTATLPFKYLRPIWTQTGGSGTLDLSAHTAPAGR